MPNVSPFTERRQWYRQRVAAVRITDVASSATNPLLRRSTCFQRGTMDTDAGQELDAADDIDASSVSLTETCDICTKLMMHIAVDVPLPAMNLAWTLTVLLAECPQQWRNHPDI